MVLQNLSKKSGFMILGFVFSFFFMVSCDLSGDSNYTPQISFVSYPIKQNGDTIHVKTISGSDELLLDTISVGDTVTFKLLLNGFSNNLQSLYLVQSADSVSRVVLPRKTAMDSIFTSASDYKNGKFYFQSKIGAVFFPFKYVARAVTKEAKFSILVVSDAKFDNVSMGGGNSASIYFRTPIKAALTANQ